MSSHRSHINSWLKDLYQDDQIPLFDQTTENYESLLKLKQQHAGATLLVKSLITEKLSKKPDLQIKLENDNALQSLSLLAQLYGTGSTELSNYFTAITNASLQEMSLNDELRNLDDIEYTLDKWNQDATAELSTISGILAGLQNHQKNAQDHSQNSLEISEQLNNKTSEYVSLKLPTRYIKEKYNSLGIEKSGISLEQLHDCQSQVRSVEDQLKLEENELKQYNGLPADMVLASVKIQEMDAKLHEYLQEREHLLTDIAQSVKHS